MPEGVVEMRPEKREGPHARLRSLDLRRQGGGKAEMGEAGWLVQ